MLMKNSIGFFANLLYSNRMPLGCIKLAENEADANKNQAKLKSVVGIWEEFCLDDAAFFPDCPVIIMRKLQYDTAQACRGLTNSFVPCDAVWILRVQRVELKERYHAYHRLYSSGMPEV